MRGRDNDRFELPIISWNLDYTCVIVMCPAGKFEAG